MQIQVALGVVSVSWLLVRLSRAIEPGPHADSISKRSQLQQRQIKRPAVEAHQRRAAIRLPSPPEILRDHVRAKLRLVQGHDVNEAEVGRNFCCHYRYRHLKR